MRTENGKEFVNAAFGELLEGHGIEIRVCKYPDVKFSFLERFNTTLKSKLRKWFTRINTYLYADFLDKYVAGYCDWVHSST